MSKIIVNQFVSKRAALYVDNMVLQAIIEMVAESKMKNGQILSFELRSCPNCQKQFICMRDMETTPDDEVEGMQCVFCEKSTNDTVIVYQFTESDTTKEISGTIQIICLKGEAEELVEQYEAKE